MGYIPPNATWYLAELVEVFTIEGEQDNVVHTNTVLVRGKSPEEAYESALSLGKESEMTYMNPDEKQVVVTFRGLRDLNVIHGDLQHGTELIYHRRTGMSEKEIGAWISDKEDLGVFRPIENEQNPGNGR